MEMSNSNSSEKFRKVFTAYYARLSEVLPIEDMLPDLVSNELITMEEMEDILAEKTSSNKARALLRGPVWRSIEVGCLITFTGLLCLMRSSPSQACVLLSKDICEKLHISDKSVEEKSCKSLGFL